VSRTHLGAVGLGLLALWMGLFAPGCGDEYVDQAATCTVLGGLIAQNLILERGCEVDASFLVDFGVACSQNEPTDEEALACLGAVYALEECPEGLPNECVLFAGEMRVAPLALQEGGCHGTSDPSRGCDIPPDPTSQP
jgi:hypothetical protein